MLKGALVTTKDISRYITGYNNWVFLEEYPNHVVYYNKKRGYKESFLKRGEEYEIPHETINHYE